ncbi:MAG: ATP-binding cassette domain-containing protein [Planctomycetaceae bacterium]|nr:ATP-binding cassette domain-containing protein [Planctomycetaceae bacterium]
MIGRELDSLFPSRRQTVRDTVRIRVRNLSVRDADLPDRFKVRNVSFEAREGEILGFNGLQGSGNTELLNGIFGTYGGLASGEITVDGVTHMVDAPSSSIRRGLSLLTNDRKASGIIPDASISDNIALASLRRLSARTWRNGKLERAAAERQQESLRIRLRALSQPIGTLSGGNQQKNAARTLAGDEAQGAAFGRTDARHRRRREIRNLRSHERTDRLRDDHPPHHFRTA